VTKRKKEVRSIYFSFPSPSSSQPGNQSEIVRSSVSDTTGNPASTSKVQPAVPVVVPLAIGDDWDNDWLMCM
jgi:hypothetical protein